MTTNGILRRRHVAAPRPRPRRAQTAFRTALALLVATLALAVPTTAGAQRLDVNLTLVLSNCESAADTAVARGLAHGVRHGAPACMAPDGVPSQTADLIADFAPDRVLLIGGETTVSELGFKRLRAAVREAAPGAVVERLSGASRVETAAAAARAALESPEVVGLDTVTLFVANGWSVADVRTAADLALAIDDAAVAYTSPNGVPGAVSPATASLIADYQPARVVVVGRADVPSVAAETALIAFLEALRSNVIPERIVATATEPAAQPTNDAQATALALEARALFTSYSQDSPAEQVRADSPMPAVALSRAPDSSGEGQRLWTVNGDGTDRRLRALDHRGWAWNPVDGRFAWTDRYARLFVDGTGSRDQYLAEQGWLPAWSPDGTHFVAFDAVDSDGDRRVDQFQAFVGQHDGSTRRRLGEVDYRTFLFSQFPNTIWSPDGQHVAYTELSAATDIEPSTPQGRITPLDASAPEVTLGDNITFLGWSPDSRRVAYATWADCDGDGRDDSQNLWVARNDGSDARDLGLIDTIQWRIVQLWSPDSTQIAYEALDPADCSKELRIEAADGSGSATSIAQGGRLLGWSPQGEFVGYAVTAGTPGRGIPLWEEVWITHRDGSEKRNLGELERGFEGLLAWSPNGTLVAYTQVLRDANDQVVGRRSGYESSSGVGQSTALAPNSNDVQWAFDGERLAYIAHHDADGDGVIDGRSVRVHAVGSDAADIVLVPELPDPTRLSRWSPDGKYVGYVTGPEEVFRDWIIMRRRGLDAWVVSADQPQWTHRIVTDLSWGEWRPAQ